MTCPDLTVVVPLGRSPWLNRAALDRLHATLTALDLTAEVLLAGAAAGRPPLKPDLGERPLPADPCDAGAVWRAAVHEAHGRYLLTLGAGPANTPALGAALPRLWAARASADVLLAQPPGAASPLRRLVGAAQRWLLGLPVTDYYQPVRLHRTEAVRPLTVSGHGADIWPEVLVRAYAEGRRVAAVPVPGWLPAGSGGPRTPRGALRAIGALLGLWRLRSSILSADYDDRAYDSPIPLQRFWQRSRFRYVTELCRGQGRVLDVGCGSSRIIGALPPGSVALDILLRKLRHARRFGRPLVQGSVFQLPFADGAFPCVVCSQVIEHLPRDPGLLDELGRVLAPGGRLVLGTPDYARWEWVWMERGYALAAPGGYAEEHITHYTHRELVDWFEARGFTVEATRYILRGELILALRKPVEAREVSPSSPAPAPAGARA